MIKILADQNFNQRILTGLIQRRPGFDLVRAIDVGLNRATDPFMLEWAANQGRVVLTHDRETMPGFAYDRVIAGFDMAGVIVADDQAAIGAVIDDLELIDDCTGPMEWLGVVD